MRFSVAATAALVAGASATYKGYGSDDTTVTDYESVTKYTTYCPSATEVTHNGKTYTVTKATTLVITECPKCTKTSEAPATSATLPPATSSPAGHPSYPSSTYAPHPSPSSPAGYPVPSSSKSTANPVPSSTYSKPETHPAPPSSYSTLNPVPSSSKPPTYPTTAAPLPSYPAGNATKPIGTGTSTSRPPVFTGAATKVGAGAGLAAIFGLAALAL